MPPDRLRRLYGDIGARGERATLNLSIGAGSNALGGNGPAPVQLLAADRRNVFTYPDRTYNRMVTLQARGTYELAEAWSLEANAYVRSFRQRTLNADIAEAEGCEDPGLGGLLCTDAGQPLRTTGGGTIGTDLLGDAPPGVVNRTVTNSLGTGGAAQVVSTEPLLGRPARVVFGASYDHAGTDFSGSSEFGSVTADRTVAGSGLILDMPGSGVQPVQLKATTATWGLFGTGTWEVTPRLAATLGGRFNTVQVQLRDQIGTVAGWRPPLFPLQPAGRPDLARAGPRHRLCRLCRGEPRADPAELACADPLRPCTLGAFFLSDPALKQVVSRTAEAGLRGTLPPAWLGGRTTWNLGLFRTGLTDDILLVQSPIQGRGYFQNSGDTRRQGVEAGLGWRDERLALALDYAMIDATFQTAQRLPSPNNPYADAEAPFPCGPATASPASLASGCASTRNGGRRRPGASAGGHRQWQPVPARRRGQPAEADPRLCHGQSPHQRADRAGGGGLWAGAQPVRPESSSFGTLYNLQTASALNLGLTDPAHADPEPAARGLCRDALRLLSAIRRAGSARAPRPRPRSAMPLRSGGAISQRRAAACAASSSRR